MCWKRKKEVSREKQYLDKIKTDYPSLLDNENLKNYEKINIYLDLLEKETNIKSTVISTILGFKP